jgi:hypothetical protein
MEYVFENGTHLQQSLWAEAVGHLLNLPLSAINVSVAVNFVPSIESGHTDLALTAWTYGHRNADTEVRDDAIAFGPNQAALEAEAAALGIPYSIEKFYMETAIHELGHAFFAALPEEHRVAIAQMFGAQSDDINELQPEGVKWQDRIAEGIAETFKEAFLPRRFRVFPNRTNKKIPYSKFPEFRKLWRDGAPHAGSEEETGSLEEEMRELPIRDLLETGPRLSNNTEEPPSSAELSADWEEWKPAEFIGWEMATVANPNVAYRTVPNNSGQPHRLPKEIGAIWTKEQFGGNGNGMAVRAFERSFNTHFESEIEVDGEVQVFLSDASRNSGYKLSARRTQRIGEFYTFVLQLERWDAGKPTLLGKATITTAVSGIGDLGLSVVGGVVTVWAGAPISAVFEVKDKTYREGFGGVGVLRDDLFLGLSEPSIAEFRAGSIPVPKQGERVEVPSPTLLPGGSVGGSLPHKRPIVGNTQ